MIDATEIKNCPFCGGKAHDSFSKNMRNGNEYIVIRCEICGGQTKPFYLGTDSDLAYRRVLSAWNRRFDECLNA